MPPDIGQGNDNNIIPKIWRHCIAPPEQNILGHFFSTNPCPSGHIYSLYNDIIQDYTKEKMHIVKTTSSPLFPNGCLCRGFRARPTSSANPPTSYKNHAVQLAGCGAALNNFSLFNTIISSAIGWWKGVCITSVVRSASVYIRHPAQLFWFGIKGGSGFIRINTGGFLIRHVQCSTAALAAGKLYALSPMMVW